MFCPKCGKELPAEATFCPSCGTPVQAGQTGSAPPVSGFDTLTRDQHAQEYWIQRLIALFIDGIIVYVILGIVTALIALPGLLAGGTALFGALFGGVSFFWGVIFVLYFAVTESFYGGSIGKRVFGLRVISRSGSNPTIGEAIVRNVSKIYWLLLLLDVVVGLATSKGYQQKYSDRMMGTTVVRR